MAIQLPPLHQRIILDPTGVKGGAAAYGSAMGGVAKASGRAGNAVASMGASITSVGFRAQSAGRILLKNFGLPIALIGGLAAASFAKFEASMLKIEALVGVSAGSVERFGEAVRAAAQETGRGPQELADAMFFVASAGLRGATAMEVLRASAKGAAVGLGQTKVVADAATSAVNAYGAENLSGSEAVDVLTAAVREGKVEANRLAPAIGKAIPVASAMGIEFHEVAAAIAAMTRTGTDARTSAIQLRQIMQSILDPSRQTTKALKEMGVAEGELRRQADEEGLLAVLKRLRDLARDNEDAFADVFPNIRALAGALDITGANLTENEGIFRALANSVGDTDDALQKTQKGAMFKFTKALADIKVQMLAVGEAMLPLLTMFVGLAAAVAGFLERIAATKVLGFIAALAALAVVGGFALIVFGKLTTVIVGFWGAITLIPTALGVATIALETFMLKVGAATLGLYALAAVVATLVIWFIRSGKQGNSTAKDLANLSAGIRDVRQAGERSLRPIHMFSEALTALGRGIPEPQHIADFNQAFGDAIEAALKVDKLGGKLQAEESLISMFAGFLADEDDQAVIDAVEEQFKTLLNAFADQFSDPKFFSRHLPPGGDVQAQLLSFLHDPASEREADMQVRIWSERIRGSVKEAIDETFRKENWEGAGRDVDTGEWFEDALKGESKIEEALGDIPTIFNQALVDGRPQDAFNMYSELLENLRNDTRFSAEQVQAGVQLLSKAFMDSVHKIDAFRDDTGEGLNTLDAQLRRIAGEGLTLGKDDQGFSGDERIIKIAEEYVSILDNLIAMYNDPALRDVEGRNIFGGGATFTEIQLQNMALRMTSQSLERINTVMRTSQEIGEDMGDTITDALTAMQSGFSKADDAAKEFTRRFDELIGRQSNMVAGQAEFNLGLQDMADALLESGGSLDITTTAGAEAILQIDAMRMMVEEVVNTMIRGGLDAEQAEAAFDSFFGSITATALANNVDPAAFRDLFDEMELTPDKMALLFKEGDETAPEALMAQALRIKEQVGPFAFDSGVDIGGSIMTGFVQGIHIYEPSLMAETQQVFDNLVKAVKAELLIGSPSIVFQNEIGVPIGEGVHQGIVMTLNASKGDFVHVLRDYIESAISITRDQITSASRAIGAVLTLEEAQQKLLKVQRETMDMETGGSRSRREDLNEAQLNRRVQEAERALRLGQGHQEDLEMALLDAREAMDDFLAIADSDAAVTKAQLDVMDAGFGVAGAQANLAMGGDKAKAAFTNMAEAVGISGDRIDELLELGEQDPDNIFEKLFSPEVRQSIEDVGAGLGIVTKELLAQQNAAGAGGEVVLPAYVSTGTGEMTPEVAAYLASLQANAAIEAGAGSADALGFFSGGGAYTGGRPSDVTADIEAANRIGPMGLPWGGGEGSINTKLEGDVNIVVATMSDIENIQRIAAAINNAKDQGFFGGTGTNYRPDTPSGYEFRSAEVR